MMPPPAHQGFGGGIDASFVWQQLADIQKSLGSIQATLQQSTAALEKTEEQLNAKIDKIEERLGGKLSKIEADVSEFKQIRHTAKVVAWIVGVAAAGILAFAGFVAKEAWGVLKPIATSAVQQTPK